MTMSINRRTLLLAGGASFLLGGCAVAEARRGNAAMITQKLAELERQSGGRLGLMAIAHAGGRPGRLGYRESERFPFCSTFKIMLGAAMLHRSVTETDLLQRRVRVLKADLVTYSPVTGKIAGADAGMPISELCKAAMQYSDNTAANLLIRELGGIGAVNEFARGIGDTDFRLDRLETALNSALPGDERDTTTPLMMAQTLQKLTLGEALPPAQRATMVEWMRGNTTGGARIRAAMPSHWLIGDRTGGGDYGTTNTIGVIWPDNASPVVLTIYFTQKTKEAATRGDVIVSAARIIREHFM